MTATSLLIAGLVALAASTGAFAADDARQITVIGEGRVDVAPDMATIRLGVTTEATEAREAIQANSAAMNAVLERLRAEGIADRDLQTSNFSVEPRWEQRPNQDRPVVTGFVARNLLSVRVRDLARLGALLDQVADDGANAFEGLSFDLQDPQPVEDEARRAAVADARRKAELFAGAAGVALGPLHSLSEELRFQGPVMMEAAQMRMSADMAVPIAEGEVTVMARVTTVYAIDE